MTDQITAMRMGDAIPEWLLSAEPMEAGAPRGNWRFTVDVHIVDTPDYYVVVPMALGQQPPLIDNNGMLNHRIYATSKPVHTITGQHVFFPEQVNAWHGATGVNGEPMQVVPVERTDTHSVEVQRPAADTYLQTVPRMTFWDRLRWLFRGS